MNTFTRTLAAALFLVLPLVGQAGDDEDIIWPPADHLAWDKAKVNLLAPYEQPAAAREIEEVYLPVSVDELVEKARTASSGAELVAVSKQKRKKPRTSWNGEHSFWDKKNIILHSLNGVLATVNVWTSARAFRRCRERMIRCRDINPLAREKWAPYALGALSVALPIGFAYAVHDEGDHDLEFIFPTATMITHGISTGFNLRFERKVLQRR